MNGLTNGEVNQLAHLKALARINLPEAKRVAAEWVSANRKRRTRRLAACRCVKGLHDHTNQTRK